MYALENTMCLWVCPTVNVKASDRIVTKLRVMLCYSIRHQRCNFWLPTIWYTMRRKRNIPICSHVRLQRPSYDTARSAYTFSLAVTILVTCVSRVSFVTLISTDAKVCVPSWMTVGLAVTARFVCLCSCRHTKLFFMYVRIHKQSWVTYLLHYFVMAQNTTELCARACVHVCVCHCACLWRSAPTSTFIIRFSRFVLRVSLNFS